MGGDQLLTCQRICTSSHPTTNEYEVARHLSSLNRLLPSWAGCSAEYTVCTKSLGGVEFGAEVGRGVGALVGDAVEGTGDGPGVGLVLGAGVGASSVAVPVYVAETAPAALRGALA